MRGQPPSRRRAAHVRESNPLSRAPDPLRYPIAGRPGDAEAMEVCAGVLWVRMALPIPGLDYINLWLLEDGDGWTIVDTGFQSKKTKAWWEEIFARYLGGRPVTRLICTHFHPDHMGLAGWLVERWPGIAMWTTFGEWSFGRMLWLDTLDHVPDDVLAFYHRIGWGAAELAEFAKRGYNRFFQVVAPIPRSIRRIVDGEEVAIGGRQWRVIVGQGHSPEHACLYCGELGVMVAGDQILPRITPHIGVYPGEPEADPLRFYLDSLELFRPLPETTLVLPSHGDPFLGLADRLDALARHHDARLDRLYRACDASHTAAELIPAMFSRRLRPEDMGLATSEGLAHLHYLMSDRRIKREIGGDGVYRFSRTGAADAAA